MPDSTPPRASALPLPIDEGGVGLVNGMQAWRRADVRQAVAEAQDHIGRLRFHEGLRRGWQEARAEAAVREAWALANLEGVRISLEDVRTLSMSPAGATVDPGAGLALGIWRSQWDITSAFAPLNARSSGRPTVATRPAPAVVAGLHRDVCSALLAAGHVSQESVAVPADPHALRSALALVAGAKDARNDAVPAFVVAAHTAALFRVRDVFSPGSMAVGAGLSRWILVQRGVDPSAVTVPSAWDAQDPPRAARALAGWMRSDVDGMAQWFIHVARGLAAGAQMGHDIALRVQAGRLE